jgi:hypothetical protein
VEGFGSENAPGVRTDIDVPVLGGEAVHCVKPPAETLRTWAESPQHVFWNRTVEEKERNL